MHANIPKSEKKNSKSETLLVPNVSDKGYSTSILLKNKIYCLNIGFQSHEIRTRMFLKTWSRPPLPSTTVEQ
jgi:hypothetical protein